MSCKNYRSMHAYMVTPTGIYNAEMMTTRLPILQVLQNYRNMAAYLMKGREESSMLHLYSMKYGNDQIQLVFTRSSASYMPCCCYFNSYEISSLDLFCAFSPPHLFSMAVSLDSIRIDCASNEEMTKVHPIAEW